MPLTVQVNGSVVGGQPNTIVASWWNDYHDLLVGTMLDQSVRLRGGFCIYGTIATPTVAPTAAAVAGTGLGVGVYQYLYVWQTPGLDSSLTGPSPAVSVTTTTNNQKVNVAAIAVGPAPTSARQVFRTKVGGSTFYYLTTLSNNTATTYTDTTADSGLNTSIVAPNNNSTGAMVIKDSTGTWRGQILPGGEITLDSGAIWSDGSGNLHVTSVTATNLTGTLLAGSQIQLYDSALATVRAARIYIGTTDPSTYTTVNEGDIWIDA